MSYKHSDTIDRDRAICELYEWHDWSYRKLGALFGITFGRVRQIIDRGRVQHARKLAMTGALLKR
jgi:DNA-directed RNA polymerase specialized sigma24 family protein